MTKTSPDLTALRYAGGMGHQYVTVCTRSDGRIETSGEFSTFDSALRLMSQGDRLYKQIAKGRWRRVLTTKG